MTLLKQVTLAMAQVKHLSRPETLCRPPGVMLSSCRAQTCIWQRRAPPASCNSQKAGICSSAWQSNVACGPAWSCSAPRLRPAYCTSSIVSDRGARDREEPIIMTIGWLGARQRPFAKYDELWRDMGYQQRLSVRPHLSSLVAPPLGDLVARKAVQQLVAATEQRANAPVFLHLFSGGGFIFVAWMFQQLAQLRHSKQAQELPSRIAGIVLDSSPAPVTADVSSRAIVAALLGQPVAGVEQRYPWLVQPTSATIKAYLGLPLLMDRLAQVQDTWQSVVPACPQLYLYSEADALVQSSVVEAFMTQQEARGVPIASQKWADSGHVEHYKQHPEQYRQQLQRFVDSSTDWHRHRQQKMPLAAEVTKQQGPLQEATALHEAGVHQGKLRANSSATGTSVEGIDRIAGRVQSQPKEGI